MKTSNWFTCPICKARMIYEGSDIEGNRYYVCKAPHTWFEKLLDHWGLWKGKEKSDEDIRS